MALRKSTGNMYPWVTHTWNPIKGKCIHDCEYCYMKVFPQKEIRFDENELKTDLGKNNFIFVGSSTDMWAKNVPDKWIRKVLDKVVIIEGQKLTSCIYYDASKTTNTYLFQSKNPLRFYEWRHSFPEKTIVGTTIETNRKINNNAPTTEERANAMNILFCHAEHLRRMVTIEPIMDFDLLSMISLIKSCNPEWVNIGADSKRHNLPEPSAEKIKKLIKELNDYKINVKVKDNLTRLLRKSS